MQNSNPRLYKVVFGTTCCSNFTQIANSSFRLYRTINTFLTGACLIHRSPQIARDKTVPSPSPSLHSSNVVIIALIHLGAFCTCKMDILRTVDNGQHRFCSNKIFWLNSVAIIVKPADSIARTHILPCAISSFVFCDAFFSKILWYIFV